MEEGLEVYWCDEGKKCGIYTVCWWDIGRGGSSVMVVGSGGGSGDCEDHSLCVRSASSPLLYFRFETVTPCL